MKPFTEKQILNAIDKVCTGLIDFSYIGIKHEDICPQLIVMTSIGNFLLSDQQFYTNMSNYDKCYKDKDCGSFAYLSPALHSSLSDRSPFPYHNSIKSEVYSLGMVGLVMATLEDPRSYL